MLNVKIYLWIFVINQKACLSNLLKGLITRLMWWMGQAIWCFHRRRLVFICHVHTLCPWVCYESNVCMEGLDNSNQNSCWLDLYFMTCVWHMWSRLFLGKDFQQGEKKGKHFLIISLQNRNSTCICTSFHSFQQFHLSWVEITNSTEPAHTKVFPLHLFQAQGFRWHDGSELWLFHEKRV